MSTMADLPISSTPEPAAADAPAVPAVPPVPDRPLLAAGAKRHTKLANLIAHDGKALDADYVHDVRVASRRLGEVARLLADNKRAMDKPTGKVVEESLKTLRRSMGVLRDADVTREHLAKWKMPAALKKVAMDMEQELGDRRAALESAARDQMATASLHGSMVILARVLEAQGDLATEREQRMHDALDDAIKKRRKQLQQAFGSAAKKQTPEALHEARIACKRLRYLLELAEEFRNGVKKDIQTLKQFQELLGDHHDAHVIVEAMQARIDAAGRSGPKTLLTNWRKWKKKMEQLQAKRAATFFVKSYAWINQ